MISPYLNRIKLFFTLILFCLPVLVPSECLAVCRLNVGECEEKQDIIEKYSQRWDESSAHWDENSARWDDKRCKDYSCLLPAMKVGIKGKFYAYCIDSGEIVERRGTDGKIYKEELRRQEVSWKNKRLLSMKRGAFCINKNYVASIEEALRDVGECVGIDYFSMLPLLIHESKLKLNAQSDWGATCLGQLTGDSVRQTHNYFKKNSAFSKQFKSEQCKSTREKIRKSHGYENFPDRIPKFVGATSRKDIEDVIYIYRRCQFLENPHLCMLYSTLQFKENLAEANKLLSNCQNNFKKLTRKKGDTGKTAREIVEWLEPENQRLTYSIGRGSNKIEVELKFPILLATWAHNAGVSLFSFAHNYCGKLKKGVDSLNTLIDEIKVLVEKRIENKNKKTLERRAKEIGEYQKIVRGIKNYKTLEKFKKFIHESDLSFGSKKKLMKGLTEKSRKSEILKYPDKVIKDSYSYLNPRCQRKTGWLRVKRSSTPASGKQIKKKSAQ